MSVTGKITSLFSVEKVTVKSTGNKLRKRDFYLSDQTAVYRCVAWESDIDFLQEDNSYQITNATIRSFNGEKYLSIGWQSEVTLIEDIGQVIDDEIPQGNSGQAKVVKSETITVVNIDHYKSCTNCFAKVPHSDTLLVICPKCNAKMKLAKCPNHSMANVILEDDAKRVYRVTIFSDMLEKIRSFGKQIVGDNNADDELLAAPCLICCFID